MLLLVENILNHIWAKLATFKRIEAESMLTTGYGSHNVTDDDE